MVEAKRSRCCCKNVTNSQSLYLPDSLVAHWTLAAQEALVRSQKLFSDIVTSNTLSLNNNVLSLRLAGEYWREVCSARRGAARHLPVADRR